jgi:hypothetical protein
MLFLNPQLRRRLAREIRTVRAQPLTSALALALTIIVVSLAVRVGCHRPGAPVPQIQVLNGSGVPELAQQASQALRDHGLDVVSIGNADSQGYRQTLVLSRRGHVGVARQVAGILGEGEVLEQLDPTLLVDVTVVLGRDYALERRSR